MRERKIEGSPLLEEIEAYPDHQPCRRPPAKPGLRQMVSGADSLARRVLKSLALHVQPAVLLSGRERWSGQPMRVLYHGHGENREYFMRLLFQHATDPVDLAESDAGSAVAASEAADRSFTDARPGIPSEAPVPDVPPYDLIIRERPLWRDLLLPDWPITCLSWIRQRIDIPDEKSLLLSGIRRKTRMEAERALRRNKLAVDVVPALPELARFYHEYYLPTLHGRFGAEAELVSESYFRQRSAGARLLRVFQGERWLGGLLLQDAGDTLVAGWAGFLLDTSGRPVGGVSDAMDYALLWQAWSEGFRYLDMGSSRAALSDGILRYKQRWGARIVAGRIPRGTWGLELINATAAVQSWLSEVALIGRSHGQLCIWDAYCSADQRISLRSRGLVD